MEHVLRNSSAFLFGLNYAGLFCAAFGFSRESEEKQIVFKQTAIVHFGFYVNTLVISHLKFRAYPYHLALQFATDLGCSLACLPLYTLWIKTDYHNYFDKAETIEKPSKRRVEAHSGDIKVLSTDDLNKA